ncbi:helix-turn-helix transcriptional regulator [Halapricum desulfuricans]|uniref:Putative membrane-associated trancriptional regulator n=1 Tax=Halapricum desulfuricans TaxID=2841257 RepID=A0A897N0H0_9EURY|nr:hypothetical protein [Halapricum desulfuricans]QSG04833.1 putative membrane-associated trancriptional regulator [Halapricum desulfuricans]
MPAWSRVTVAVALASVLLVAGIAPLHALSPGAAPTSESHSHAVGAQVQALPESSFEVATTYRIDVQSDGDARWTINRTFRFENASHREGFETVADRFVGGEYSGQTVDAFEGASDLAAETTGREMGIADVSRDARTGNDSGSLLLSFTWANFSHENGNRLHVDDVFQTDPRWFPDLSGRETLIIARPAGYQYYSASTNVQNQLLRWEGPHTFGASRPYAVFSPISPPSDTTTGPPNGTTSQTDGPAAFVLGAVALLGVLVVLGYAARVGKLPGRRPTVDSGSNSSAAAGVSQTGNEPNGNTDGQRAVADERGESADSEGAGDGAHAAGSTAAAITEEVTEEADKRDERSEDEIAEELLSDEERVERLLDEHGGRMKQARIVEETGWSNAKVSQLLSAMDEDGRIEKLRIGRENLISLPDEESDQ